MMTKIILYNSNIISCKFSTVFFEHVFETAFLADVLNKKMQLKKWRRKGDRMVCPFFMNTLTTLLLLVALFNPVHLSNFLRECGHGHQ